MVEPKRKRGKFLHPAYKSAEIKVQEQKQLLARNSNNYFKLFEENADGWASKAGYDRQMFQMLVGEMVNSELFLHRCNSMK